LGPRRRIATWPFIAGFAALRIAATPGAATGLIAVRAPDLIAAAAALGLGRCRCESGRQEDECGERGAKPFVLQQLHGAFSGYRRADPANLRQA